MEREASKRESRDRLFNAILKNIADVETIADLTADELDLKRDTQTAESGVRRIVRYLPHLDGGTARALTELILAKWTSDPNLAGLRTGGLTGGHLTYPWSLIAHVNNAEKRVPQRLWLGSIGRTVDEVFGALNVVALSAVRTEKDDAGRSRRRGYATPARMAELDGSGERKDAHGGRRVNPGRAFRFSSRTIPAESAKTGEIPHFARK